MKKSLAKDKTASEDDLTLESWKRKLRKDIKGFKKQSPEVQHRLASLIFNFNPRQFPHSKYEGYSTIKHGTFYNKFGKGFKDINDELGIFDMTEWYYDISKETTSRNYARGVRLTPKVKKTLDNYLNRHSKSIDKLLTSDGHHKHKSPKAVASKDTNGVTTALWRDIKFESDVLVGVETLKKAKQVYKGFLKIYESGTWNEDLYYRSENPDDLKDILEAINKILKLANTDMGKGRGYVHHRYIECSTGRLFAQDINLQTIIKVVKQAALHGLWEYDFENCHYAIFKQLANKIGIECPAVDNYLRNKKKIRNQIAKEIGILLDDAKTCLIAIIYGANSFEWEEAKIPKLIGLDKSTMLIKHPRFKAIKEEVGETRPEIINQWDNHGQYTYINHVGKRVWKNESQKKILAHLIQGIEVLLLNTILHEHSKNIVLLQHDGFASTSRLSTTGMEKLLKDKTGFDMPVEEEIIQIDASLSLPKWH